jgi:putative flippase GtrA
MKDLAIILRRFDIEIVRFGIVGIAASLTHFISVYLIVSGLGIRPIIANIFAFMIAFGVSYTGHSLWTFRHKKHEHNKTIARFLGVALFSFALNEGGYYLLLEFSQLDYLISLLIVLIIVPIVTFILSKYWAFN